MANIFLSYASEDFSVAQQLYFALVNLKHRVFFDKQSLKPGEEFNFEIIDNIRESDFAILLLSQDFLSEGSYCRTELKIIQSNWPIPSGKIFPVIIREISFDILPDYIKSVTVLKPDGNLIAETVRIIQDKLLGFTDDDSISRKVRLLELDNELEILDAEWSSEKRKYLIKMGEKLVTPSNELAVIFGIACLLFSFFNYFFIVKDDFEFFGFWPVLFPAIIGVFAFFYIIRSTSKFKAAEKYYFSKRQSIMSKYPRDNTDYLAMYK